LWGAVTGAIVEALRLFVRVVKDLLEKTIENIRGYGETVS